MPILIKALPLNFPFLTCGHICRIIVHIGKLWESIYGSSSMGRYEKSKRAEILPGTLEMLILKSLERNTEPMHGFGIALYLGQISKDVLQVEEGSLYPALQRLALKGWVRAEWGQSGNKRRARYYNLTPIGREQLKQEVADFERLLEAIMLVMQPAGGGPTW